MYKEVTPKELQSEFTKLMDQYGEIYNENVKNVAEKYGKEAKKDVKAKSKQHSGQHQWGSLYLTGDYRKGWSIKSINKKNTIGRIIWNKTDYPLVHLLEFGHGGPWTAKAYPHVREIELKYLEKFVNELKKKAKKNDIQLNVVWKGK